MSANEVKVKSQKRLNSGEKDLEISQKVNTKIIIFLLG